MKNLVFPRSTDGPCKENTAKFYDLKPPLSDVSEWRFFRAPGCRAGEYDRGKGIFIPF